MAMPRNAAEWDAYWADPRSAAGGFSQWANSGAVQNQWTSLTTGNPDPLGLGEMNIALGGNAKNVRPPFVGIGPRTKRGGLPKDEGNGGLGGWLSNLVGDTIEIATGLPGAIKLGAQFVGGGIGTAFTAGQNETTKRWLSESSSLLGAGLKDTGAAWKDLAVAAATFGKKGDARYFFEDPGYMLLDLGAAASLGSGATVRTAAAVNKAARKGAAKQRGVNTARPVQQAEALGKHFEKPINQTLTRTKDRALRDLSPGDIADLAYQARNSPKVGKRTNRNPQRDLSIDPSDLRRSPGAMNAGRIMRRDYLEGRDLVADPLSRLEQVALRTNWARLQPKGRFSPMRGGAMWQLTPEQAGWRKAVDNPDDSEMLGNQIEIRGRKRSSGPLRRGVQGLVVNQILGPAQRRAINNANERAQGAGVEAMGSPGRIEKALNPFPRLEKGTARRAKREAVEAASTASVQAGGMPLAASIRRLNKDKELSVVFQELAQAPPHTYGEIRRQLKRVQDLRRQEAKNGGWDKMDKDERARWQETDDLFTKILDPDNPHAIFQKGSRQQRLLADALNNAKRYSAELEARGLSPSRLMDHPNRLRSWRDVEFEARTAVSRMVRGGGAVRPLEAAGKDGHRRVVNVPEYLKREGEARFDPVRAYDDDYRTRAQTAQAVQRNMDMDIYENPRGDTVGRAGSGSVGARLRRRRVNDVGEHRVAQDMAMSTLFTPRTSAILMGLLSERRAGRLNETELKGLTHTDHLEGGHRWEVSKEHPHGKRTVGNAEARNERGLLEHFNSLAQALEDEYKRVGRNAYVRRDKPDMKPIPVDLALARLSDVSLKRVRGKKGKKYWALFDSKKPSAAVYDRISPQGPRKLTKEFEVEGDTGFLDRVREAIPDETRIARVQAIQKARLDKDPYVQIISRDMRDPIARAEIIDALEQYAQANTVAGKTTIAMADRAALAKIAAIALRDREFVERMLGLSDEISQGNGLRLHDILDSGRGRGDRAARRFETLADEYVYEQTGWIIKNELKSENFDGADPRDFILGDLEANGRNNKAIIDWGGIEKQVERLGPEHKEALYKAYQDDAILGMDAYSHDAVFWNHTLRTGSKRKGLEEPPASTVQAVGGEIDIKVRNYELWMNGQISYSTAPYLKMLDATVRSAGQESFLGQVVMTHAAKNRDGQIMYFKDQRHMEAHLDPNQWVLYRATDMIATANAVERRRLNPDGTVKEVDVTTDQVWEQWSELVINARHNPEIEAPMYQVVRDVPDQRKPDSFPHGAGEFEKRMRDPEENNGGFAIRREMLQEVNELSRTPSKLMAKYDNFLNAWRAGLLALAPRWFLNNFLGNTFFFGMATGFDLNALKLAYGAMKMENGKGLRSTYGSVHGANTGRRIGGSQKRLEAETGEYGPDADGDPRLFSRTELLRDAERRQRTGDIEQSRFDVLGYGVEGSTYSSQGQGGGRFGQFNQEDTPFTGMVRNQEGTTKMSRLYWDVTDAGFRVNQNFEALMRRAVAIHMGKQALRANGAKTKRRFLPRKWDKSLTDYETMKAIASLDESTMRNVLQETRNWIGDYGNLTRVERNVIRRAIPFYSWLRVINTWLFGLPFRSPLRAELLATASQLGQIAYGEDQSVLPWWERGRINFGNGVALRTSGMNPLASVVEPLRDVATSMDQGNLNPADLTKQAVKSVMGSSAPMIQAGAAIAGKNLFGDREFTGPADYYGAVTPYGGQPQYFNPATGEYETRSHSPSLGDIIAEAMPGFSVVQPMVRTMVAGNRTPYDTADTMEMVWNKLGLPGASEDKDLYQPPRSSSSGRTPFMNPALRPLLSMAGAPLYNVDHDQEVLNYLAQQAKRKQNLAAQRRLIARQEELRRIQSTGGFANP